MTSFTFRALVLAACTLATCTLASTRTVAAQSTADTGYTRTTTGIRQFELGALKVKVLLDSAALRGGEFEMVELTFPAGAAGGAHTHSRLEIIYVLEGEMDHVVNGVAHKLKPGSTGVVRVGDTVVHRVTSATPVRALVMWAPGGELRRIER